MKFSQAVAIIEDEAKYASSVWPSFNSVHEGYAIILEEMDELWEAIKKKPRNILEVRDEAIQVGAMAVRFLTDLSP